MKITKAARLAAVIVVFLLVAHKTAYAEKWSRKYIQSLPDSAFAVIETDADGRKVRRLPHHDLSGAVDRPHLFAALRLWHWTHWLDPENAKIAWEHLRGHLDVRSDSTH